MKNLLYACIPLFIFSIESEAQQFLNGSFETNTSTNCEINISSSTYNSSMSNSRSFGALETIDILNNNHCQFGTVTIAQDGDWFIGLDTYLNTSTSNNVSLELSDSLIASESYELSYYDASPFSLAMEQLEIGLSTNDSTFGDLIYTSPLPSPLMWTKRTFIIQAPNNGNYVTLRVKVGQTQRWVIVDNFTISPVTVTSKEKYTHTTQSVNVYPNPATNEISVLFGEVQGSISIDIYNTTGLIVAQNQFTNVQIASIDISTAPKGMYYLKIQSLENREYTIKNIIKN